MPHEPFAALNAHIRAVSAPLPGSVPMDNARPMRLGLSLSGLPLIEALCRRHPHLGADHWQRAIAEGRLTYNGQPAAPELCVAAGAVVVQTDRAVVEPAVNPELSVIFWWNELFAVNKPAPLPVHPSGHYNRNTATHILSLALPELELRPVHRLDACTTGVLLFATSRRAARHFSAALGRHEVQKRYLAEVHGVPVADAFVATESIATAAGEAGSRAIEHGPAGKVARTAFTVRARGQERSLLVAEPITGRTNQIRLHLAARGLPIVGDTVYGEAAAHRAGQPFTAAHALHLHAWQLGFVDQHGAAQLIEAPPPSWAAEYVLAM